MLHMFHTHKYIFKSIFDRFLDPPKVVGHWGCDAGQVTEFGQDHRPCDAWRPNQSKWYSKSLWAVQTLQETFKFKPTTSIRTRKRRNGSEVFSTMVFYFPHKAAIVFFTTEPGAIWRWHEHVTVRFESWPQVGQVEVQVKFNACLMLATIQSSTSDSWCTLNTDVVSLYRCDILLS